MQSSPQSTVHLSRATSPTQHGGPAGVYATSPTPLVNTAAAVSSYTFLLVTCRHRSFPSSHCPSFTIPVLPPIGARLLPAMSSAPLVGVCLGTMEFGRYSTEAQAQRMVSSFLAAGFTEADTASMYVDGESERILGRLPSSLTSRLVVHTKANPWFTDAERKGLTRTSVLNQGHQSLASLKLTPSLSSPPLDIFYLHAPDHSTPIMDTLSAVHALHQEGAFRRFGLSNYSSWQVMEIHHLCTQRGIIRPTVYQVGRQPLTTPTPPITRLAMPLL